MVLKLESHSLNDFFSEMYLYDKSNYE